MSAPRTQLWQEEYEILSRLAESVPEHGTIVEIGTAEGGTARLMYRAVEDKDVKIYTVDAAPSPKAFEHLRGTGVTIVPEASADYVKTWAHTVNRPIDFLFIDGNHDLEHVVGDWNLWTPFLTRGGVVAFHDYDPPERGGIVHLAVRVCVETILRCNFLKNLTHSYRFGYGVVERPQEVFVSAEACCDTLASIGRGIVQTRDVDYSDAYLVADERLTTLLRGCLKSAVNTLSLEQARDPNKSYLVGAQPDGKPPCVLRERRIPDANITILDSLTVCYLVAPALQSNYAYLVECASAFNEFLPWMEMLAMFEHAFGDSVFPDALPPALDRSDIRSVSRFVAHEQVRLVALARLLRAFVDWTP